MATWKRHVGKTRDKEAMKEEGSSTKARDTT